MNIQTNKDIIKALKKVQELKLKQVAEINNLIYNFENNEKLTIKSMRKLTEELLRSLGIEEGGQKNGGKQNVINKKF